MSHSRIIQVTRKRVDKSGWLKAADLDLCQLRGEIECIDYVSDTDDRESELEWLRDQLERVGFTLDGENILSGCRTDFIERWRALSVEAAGELDLYKMKLLASGVYFSGFYIHDEEFGYPVPLWAWAKDVLGTNQTFYVGEIIDYHF